LLSVEELFIAKTDRDLVRALRTEDILGADVRFFFEIGDGKVLEALTTVP
jgi:hypothetical protein